MSLRFGSDPEFFLMKNGVPLIAAAHFPEPIEVPSFGFLAHDGIVGEVNPLPSNSVVEMTQRCLELFSIAKHRAGAEEISFAPVMDVSQQLLDEAAQVNPITLEFGCSPDVSAWGDKFMSTRGSAKGIMKRYTGGHIHIGGIDAPADEKVELVRAIDRTFGLVMNAFATPEEEKARRVHYGKPGACRLKWYGIEYRAPSGALFKSNVETEIALRFLKTIVKGWQVGYTYQDVYASDDEVLEMIMEGETSPNALTDAGLSHLKGM